MKREEWGFCVFPVAATTLCFVIALVLGDVLIRSDAVWAFAIAVCFFCVISFLGYFNTEADNRLCWTAILMSGAATICVFAAFHANAGVFCATDICGSASGRFHYDFATAIYFSIVTFTTLGYGDFQPNPALRLLAAIQALFGYLYLGLFVGAAIHWGANRINR